MTSTPGQRRSTTFKAGEARTVESAQKGGQVSADVKRYRTGESAATKNILDRLAGESTGGWMDRLGLVEPSWATWRVIGKVLDGMPLDPSELPVYTALSERTSVPLDLRELWAIAGRGSGKTTFAAVCATKAACRRYAVRGVARVLLLAFGKEQAGVAFECVSEFFEKDPDLRKLITRRRTDSLTLAHGVMIQTIASGFRQVRAYSVACAIADEIAFWWNDDTNANPDKEVLRALRPGLGKVPGSRLLAVTTPWTEAGEVYEQHERHFGKETARHVLVIKAPTLTLNPAYDRARIETEAESDPESAASEFGVAWRVAGGTLVRPAVLDAAIDTGVVERAPEPPVGDDFYTAAVDLSGGTGEDSAALSIVHEADGETESAPSVVIQDVLREWPAPFDPGTMCAEIAAVCRQFGITEVVGDQFSEGFAGSEFRRHGITYLVSPRKTAECVLDSLAILNTARVRLLDNPKARRQWLSLRRDYASGGRPTIAESKRHDDLAVVSARAIVVALGLGVEEEKRLQVKFG